MKAVWSDMFYDIDECNESRDEATKGVALSICRDLIEAENAIEQLEPKKAIEILREIRRTI